MIREMFSCNIEIRLAIYRIVGEGESATDDRETIRRVLAGKTEAFGELVIRRQDQVLRVCRRRSEQYRPSPTDLP